MLTHLDEKDRPKMVDVSPKDPTKRVATASGIIKMSKDAFKAIKENTGKKGPVIQTAVVAAIMGAKKTSELIPMCHPLAILGVDCDIEELPEICAFKLYVSVKIEGKTGVSVGLLTIYDMVKAIDKGMEISNIVLESKTGGKSGEYMRSK